MDNKDTIVALMREIPQVTEAGYEPVPSWVAPGMPEGSLAFYTRRVVPPDPPPGTWPGRDDLARIYLPPFVFENPEMNQQVLAQMNEVLANILNDDIPVADVTPAPPPETPPPEVPETQNEAELTQPATNP